MIHSVLAAALVVGSLASPSAAPSSDTKNKVVDYADLDLSSSAGLKALHRRICVAIADVCGEAGPASHEEVIDIERCRTRARAGTSVQIAAITARLQVAGR
jgi:UrcA family protein